jgi:hypothetical protein
VGSRVEVVIGRLNELSTVVQGGKVVNGKKTHIFLDARKDLMNLDSGPGIDAAVT